MLAKLNSRTVSWAAAALYAVELLDELIYGLQGAVMPLIKSDLALTYTEIGLLTTVPGLIGIMVDPFLGILGDTRWRRALVRAGLAATTGGLALTAFGQTYALLLLAFVILFLGSGAYVNLAQATLMDRDPARSDQTMARWTLLGSIGVAVAPLLVAAVFGLGYGWRALYLGLAGAAGVYLPLVWRVRFDLHAGAEQERVEWRELARGVAAALRHSDLLRWVLLTELADLMLDKLYDVTGLYFYNVVGVDFALAALASSVFTMAGLVGNAALIPALERFNGVRMMRRSALVVLILYAAFLLTPFVWAKYVLIALVSFGTAGWFAILRGRTYAALPGQSGMVVGISSVANLSVLLTPTILGAVADALGLQTAMWILILGPLALILFLPRGKE